MQPNNPKSFWPTWASFFPSQPSEDSYSNIQNVFRAFQAMRVIRGPYNTIERHYVIFTESVSRITADQADRSALQTVGCYIGGIILAIFLCLKVSKAFSGPAVLVVIYYSARPPPPPSYGSNPSSSITATPTDISREGAVPPDVNDPTSRKTTRPPITNSMPISDPSTAVQISRDPEDTDDPIPPPAQQEFLNTTSSDLSSPRNTKATSLMSSITTSHVPILESSIQNDLGTSVQIPEDLENTVDPTIHPEQQELSPSTKDESALRSNSNPGHPLISPYPYPTIISMPMALSDVAPRTVGGTSHKSASPIESPKSDIESQSEQQVFDYSPSLTSGQGIREESTDATPLSSKESLLTIELPSSAAITPAEGSKDITIEQSPITAHPKALSPQPDPSAPDSFQNPTKKQIEEEPHKETEAQPASTPLSPLQQASEIRKKIKIEMQKAIKMLLNQSEMFTTILIQEIRYPLPQSFRQIGQERIKHFLELSKTFMQMDHTSDKQEKALDEASQKESYHLLTLKLLIQHFQLLQKFMEYQNNMASDLQLTQDQAYKEAPLGKHPKAVEKEGAKPGIASGEIPPPRNIKDLLESSAMLTAMLMKKDSDRYSIQTFISVFQKSIEQCLETSQAFLGLSIKQLNTSLPIQKEPLSETYQKGPADIFILKFNIQHLQLLQKFKEHENLTITPTSRL